MDILIALVIFGIGLGLIIFFAEQLVKGIVGTSLGFGLSTFLLSVIFIGFDPDNLAVGAVASAEGASDIALGSIKCIGVHSRVFLMQCRNHRTGTAGAG